MKKFFVNNIVQIVFIVLLTVFYFVASGVSAKIYDQPGPEIETLVKYSISRFADWIEFDFFYFSLPEEWEEVILAAYPNFPRSYLVKDYHLLLDNLKNPMFYKIFPFYFLGVCVLCFCLRIFKAAMESDEPLEAKQNDKYSRGIKRAEAKEFCDKIEKEISDPAAAVETDGGMLFFSGNRLREHMSIFGASGTGKSQFLLAFMASFLANKDSATPLYYRRQKRRIFRSFRDAAGYYF